MPYGTSADSYSSRVKELLAREDAASLLYATLELRCGVEARMKEYLDPLEHIPKAHKKEYSVVKLGKAVDNAFQAKDQIAIFTLCFPDGREEVSLRYIPVPKRLQDIAARAGDALHFPGEAKMDDPLWWHSLRAMIEEGSNWFAWVSVPQCCLTPRSTGAPTAGHQARSGGTRYILASPGLAPCRRRPVSSNVRPHRTLGSVRMLRKPSSLRSNEQKRVAPNLHTFELVTTLLSALAWPIVVAAIALAFSEPIFRIGTAFAVNLERASKVSIGSFSLEVAQIAKQTGDPTLADQVGGLSAAAVEQLLRTPRSGYMLLMGFIKDGETTQIGLPAPVAVRALEELETKGMLQFRQPLQPSLAAVRQLAPASPPRPLDLSWYRIQAPIESPDVEKLRNQGYSLTTKGSLAVDAIIKAVASQLPRGAA